MTVRLSLIYAAIFLFIGILLPFWPVWLKSRGMDAAEIGIILSIGMWVRAVTSPLVAHHADRSGRLRPIIVTLGWATLAGYGLFAVADGFWALAAVTALVTMLFSPMLPLTDTVTMHNVRVKGLDYGRIRLWGSLTFIAAATGGGALLAEKGEGYILWMMLGALVLTALAAHGAPRAPEGGVAGRTGPAPRRPAPLIEVLSDRRFLAFLLAASLAQASHAVYYVFATLHWRDAGHSDAVIGALWAEGVIAEIVLFAFSGAVVARLGPARLLALAAMAGIVRWSVLGMTTALPALVLVQGLHAFTFGAAHLAIMHFIARNVAPEVAATAQSLYSSTAMGAVMGLATLGSGWLYAAYSGKAFFAAALVSLAALVIVTVLDISPDSTAARS